MIDKKTSSFGLKLNKYLKIKGLTKVEFSKRVGISRYRLWQYSTGAKEISLKAKLAIMQITKNMIRFDLWE